MKNRGELQQFNQQWQRDDTRWREEIESWEREIQRMVALLYLLEKNLPDYSSSLEAHKARIDSHNKEILECGCGLDPRCPHDCPSHIDMAANDINHTMLAQRHEMVAEDHARFRREYQLKMDKVRELARRLLGELGES